MAPRKRPKKKEDFNEAAFRVVREATEEKPHPAPDSPAPWTRPTEEESPPPKIP